MTQIFDTAVERTELCTPRNLVHLQENPLKFLKIPKQPFMKSLKISKNPPKAGKIQDLGSQLMYTVIFNNFV
jgi:hypothetical protein